jgi:hypothetical protein
MSTMNKTNKTNKTKVDSSAKATAVRRRHVSKADETICVMNRPNKIHRAHRLIVVIV